MTRAACLSVEEAGRVVGLSRGSAYEAARKGEIPTLKIGRRVLVPRAKLQELIGEDPLEVLAQLDGGMPRE